MTLKTLMAKLKAQDWGAMDQTLVKHRCTLLSACLRTALATGYAEVDPVIEELKNLDSQEVIPSSDSQAVFYLEKSLQERQEGLQQLLVSWHREPARNDIAELKQHLQTIVQARVTHVDSWLASNISRFQADNADIRALKREHEELSESLRANAQPCFAECSSCRLPCLLVKSHESQDHDCNTSHECLEICEFLDDHDEFSEDKENCNLPAGHVALALSMFVGYLVISSAGEDANNVAPRVSITRTRGTRALLGRINAESLVVCATFQHSRAHYIPATAFALDLLAKNTTSTAVTTECLVLFDASSASAFALWVIISMVWMALLLPYIFAARSTAAIMTVNFPGSVK
ncbi:hypothetical protein FRB95_001259 [Tulasnella sp. JGI-2019a]|nr:hypothetical protein FRB95_001259 [Tulasnella sp. JGI-2019a]